MTNKKVAIVHKIVPHYRIELFNKLEKLLAARNIELSVFSGTPPKNTTFNDGLSEISCGTRVKNFYFLNNRIYWQNLFFTLRDFDLIVLEQSNAQLVNLPLLLHRRLFQTNPAIAFWGHGAALNRNGTPIREFFKRSLLTKADYWFGYSEHTKNLFQQSHIPDNRITIVNNSIDTSEISNLKKKFDKSENRKNWNIPKGPTVVFCSRLIENKAVPFIIKSCLLARKKIKNLNLIIIGDGPARESINDMTKEKNWITLTGALYGSEKAAVLLLADMMALPSGVGLSILDGFAAGLPILVADFNNNGPEIAYFEDGKNGIYTSITHESYSKAIIRLCSNPDLLQKMKNYSSETATRFTLQNMVNNFSTGIKNALMIN